MKYDKITGQGTTEQVFIYKRRIEFYKRQHILSYTKLKKGLLATYNLTKNYHDSRFFFNL